MSTTDAGPCLRRSLTFRVRRSVCVALVASIVAGGAGCACARADDATVVGVNANRVFNDALPESSVARGRRIRRGDPFRRQPTPPDHAAYIAGLRRASPQASGLRRGFRNTPAMSARPRRHGRRRSRTAFAQTCRPIRGGGAP
jgi:hypothetical protein